MTYFQSIVLGIVQGLTEFLPISSSGHLVIVPSLLGWKFPEEEAFIFNVLVQMGTLLAVIGYFWRDLVRIGGAFLRGFRQPQFLSNPDARLGLNLILATIPAGIAGILLHSLVEEAFSSPILTGLFLWGTAGLLILAEHAGKRSYPVEGLTWQKALTIGFFQVLSLFPGVSRSGTTITGGMLQDLERPAAARFSFLMSIPIMFAAGGLEVVRFMQMPNIGSLLPVFLAGLAAAAIVGYLSIHWLLRYLAHRSLLVFSIYCFLLGFAIIVFTILKA